MQTSPGPRLADLARTIGAGHGDTRDELAAFWTDVTTTGTPLVEPDDDPDHRLLSFLWRDDGTTDNVVLVGGPARWSPITDDLLHRLPGTDVWHATYRVGSDFIGSYSLSVNDSLVDPDDVTDWVVREEGFRPDPLNARLLERPANPADPSSSAQTTSGVVLQASRPDPGPPAPRDTLGEHLLASDVLGNTRRIWVHRSGAGSTVPPDLVVILDGWVWARVLPVSQVVDVLHAAHELDDVVVVMVDSLDEDTRCREMEGDPRYAHFLADELLPWVRQRWAVTDDPVRSALVGQSLGGLTAVLASVETPCTFGAVVSQSGSFWWPRDDHERPLEELTPRVRELSSGPSRFHLTVGSFEGEDMLGPNRRMRDALRKTGHEVAYAEPSGGHDWFRWWHELVTVLPWALPARSTDHHGNGP